MMGSVSLARYQTCRLRGMHTKRPERLKGFSYIGYYRYSLTFCMHFRSRVFVTADVVELVLFQPWGFERVLRDDEASFAVARYVVENPVRAGLVKTVADYPFVGSQVYELKDLVESLPQPGPA